MRVFISTKNSVTVFCLNFHTLDGKQYNINNDREFIQQSNHITLSGHLLLVLAAEVHCEFPGMNYEGLLRDLVKASV